MSGTGMCHTPADIAADDDGQRRLAYCEMFLRDGRAIDLSGLTVREALALVEALHIAVADISYTLHADQRPQARPAILDS